MRPGRRCHWLAVWVVLYAGCAVVPESGVRAPLPPQPLSGEPRPQGWLDEPGRAWALDRDHSTVALRVYRSGRLARLGHNHVIEVRDLDGSLIRLDSGGGVADLRFRPDRLWVDDPQARARYGEPFAGMPDPKAVEGTRRNLLGAEVLDADNWPHVAVLARIDRLAPGPATVELHLSLRGTGRRYRVPVSIEDVAGGVSVSGSFLLRQTDLGIIPFSVLAGALVVRDEIEVDFRIVGHDKDPAL